MTQINGQRITHLDSEDKPERSRNAKAQARHRAKRKAYIEQLESTVTKLQTRLGKNKLRACLANLFVSLIHIPIRLLSRTSSSPTTSAR
jgi:hypothetical protein